METTCIEKHVMTRTSGAWEPDAFQPLPALRGLARLADLRPVLIIDTREQTPLRFTRLASRRGTLQSGDYSFAGGEESFAIERKTIPDLVACCVGNGRERFFRELHRLRGFGFARLVIIGTVAEIESANYRAGVSPAAVLATIAAIEARFVSVVFTATPADAACQIERWAYWYAREICVTANTLLRGIENKAGRSVDPHAATSAACRHRTAGSAVSGDLPDSGIA